MKAPILLRLLLLDDDGDSAAVRGNISDVSVLLVPDGFWVQSAPGDRAEGSERQELV